MGYFIFFLIYSHTAELLSQSQAETLGSFPAHFEELIVQFFCLPIMQDSALEPYYQKKNRQYTSVVFLPKLQTQNLAPFII